MKRLLSIAALLFFALPLPLRAEVRQSGLWFLPPCVTVGGHEIDGLLLLIFWIVLAVFVGVQGTLLWFLYRYRRQEGRTASPVAGSWKAEVIWTVIPTAVFLLLFCLGEGLWKRMIVPPPPGTAIDIEVCGEQYDWVIRYPGPDGLLGRADDAKRSPDNKVGLDPADPAGADDVTAFNELVVPVGKLIHLHLRSLDVIHGFYAPEFRIHQDLLPGRTINWISFTAERTGEFSIACSQLCGSGHGLMQGRFRVVTEAEWEAWVKGARKP
ncbi:cytochrome c oxidase subunit 2 [Verrucomicrobium sp. GAS474]|uniref:cytochrome c oxidase subunit II n=1 Tax=Verrucomicrobium sp. GAS474 TaxID=1882831 RepID=UPI00087AE694|nr:cytochrome c oxidase subunit II [Verrucomicrobium sp. GAS474]SDU17253.1 cytochrome c oxidase subunit 2 [Verrucomicrobium sp. GAS474]